MSAAPDPLDEAAQWVKSGGLLAFPTETVWGLAADARSEEALRRLRRWKRRETDQPVSVLVDNVDAAEAQGASFSRPARLLADAFWPGPLTLIVPAEPRFATGVARADGAVGLRCSSHPVAGALVRRLDREGAGPALGIGYITLLTDRPPLDNQQLRRALAFSLDRELLTKRVTDKLRPPLRGLVPPKLPGALAAWPKADAGRARRH